MGADDEIERLKASLHGPRDESGDTNFMFIYLPEPLEPDARYANYHQPLDAELQMANLGHVSGGGSLLSAEQLDGSRNILWCGLDVEAADVGAARELLRRHLPNLGCFAGTRIRYLNFGIPAQDRYDGAIWTTGEPQDDIPGFDD